MKFLHCLITYHPLDGEQKLYVCQPMREEKLMFLILLRTVLTISSQKWHKLACPYDFKEAFQATRQRNRCKDFLPRKNWVDTVSSIMNGMACLLNCSNNWQSLHMTLNNSNPTQPGDERPKYQIHWRTIEISQSKGQS